MTGIKLTVEISQAESRAGLRAILERMEDRLPFYRAVGERMVSSSKDRFRSENAPDGSAWTPLRPATIKARQKRSRSAIAILRERGYLAGSINYDATSAEVAVGSVSEYAAIHQLGGVIDKPARAAKIYRKLERDGSVGRRFVKKTLKRKVETDVTIPAHKISIPARPFLGLTAADEAGIRDDAEGWLIR